MTTLITSPSDSVIIEFFKTFGPVLMALIGLFQTWMIMKASSVVKKLEINTNSIKDALIQTTADSKLAEGKLLGNVAGREELRTEQQTIKATVKETVSQTLKDSKKD